MPPKTNKKKSKGAKSKAAKSNAANKDDLPGLNEMLSNPEELAAAQREAAEKGLGHIGKSGAENARIGMRGFTQATQNPEMFSEAMGMLGDPSAVKEAEAMMNDPEFKDEMSRYMDTLKQNPAFQTAMQEAQRKFQLLMQDPEGMKQAQAKYEALMSKHGSVAKAAAAGDIGSVTGGKAGGEEATASGVEAAEETPAETATDAPSGADGGDRGKGVEEVVVAAAELVEDGGGGDVVKAEDIEPIVA